MCNTKADHNEASVIDLYNLDGLFGINDIRTNARTVGTAAAGFRNEVLQPLLPQSTNPRIIENNNINRNSGMKVSLSVITVNSEFPLPRFDNSVSHHPRV